MCLVVLFVGDNGHGQAQSFQTVVQKGHELAVLAVAVSADSNFAVTSSRDRTAIIWDLRTGRQVRVLPGHNASVTAIAIAPDAKTLITGSNDKTVRLWDMQSGRELFSIETSDYISNIVIDPQSRFFIHAGYNDSGRGDTAYVREYRSRKIVARIPVDPDKGLGSGVHVSISPDGKYFATGEDNRVISLYETSGWTRVQKLEYPEGYCGGCGSASAFSPDGKHLYFASHHGVLKRFELASASVDVLNDALIDELQGMAISPDGRRVAISTEEKIWVVNVATGKMESELKADEKGKFHRISFTLDGDQLLAASDDNTVQRWDYQNQRLTNPLSGFLAGRDRGGLNYDPNFYWESHIARYVRYKNKLMVSRDGKSLIKGRFGKKVRQWDIVTGRILMDFSSHKKAVLAYALSKDGKRMLTGGGDGKIVLWNVQTGDSIRVIQSYREPIFDIHFNSDESMALSSSWDGSMKIHSLATGKMETYIEFEKGSAYALLFHPNDLYVFTARLDNSLQMWEKDTRTVVRNFIGHTGIVSSLAITADQKTLMSGSWDGSIRLWDIASGLMTRKIVHSPTAVHAAAFVPGESMIVAAGADRVIRFWDLNSGKLVRSLEGHDGEITDLAISNDRKMLISQSVDGVIKLWNLETGKEFYEHIHIGENDWLVKNREGYFNGTDGARQFVHFVDGLKSYNVDQFFQDYYRPDLLPKSFQSRGEEGAKGVDSKLKGSPPPTIKVAALPLNGSTGQVLVRMIDNGSGARNLRILHNGKSIPLPLDEITYPKGAGEVSTFKLNVNLIGGTNTFTAIASNKDNVESDPRSVELFAESEVKHSICHVFAIGINEYRNEKMNLNYAKPDADSFSKLVDAQSSSLFKEIRIHGLYDRDASRSNILNKLDDLSTEVHQEDVFIFYYAGHGSMVENKFYFIPTENLRLYDENGLQKDAIEAGLVQEKLRKIPALKQLIVMDACQSGGSVELLATRGASEEKAIAQLSRSSGVHVLASAGSEQFATEFAELGHGLFTYVLLKALEGEADGAPKDGKVTIYELKSYIDDQVPEMTRKMKGKPQYPYTFSRGQDFPVVMKR